MEEKYVDLNKVYTKRGDKGETDLLGGSKAKKNSLKVNAYGDIDEASSFLGLVRFHTKDKEIKDLIFKIQNRLLVLGGYLASDNNGKNMLKDLINEEDVKFLEQKIDEYNEKLEPIFKFIIPGNEEVSTYMHIARTTIRRAERNIVALTCEENLDSNVQKYVNRLSDLLFVIARYEEEK